MYIISGITSYFATIFVSIVTAYSWRDGEKKLAAVNFVLAIALSVLTIVCFCETPRRKSKRRNSKRKS